MKTLMGTIKINLRQSKLSYLIFGIAMGLGIANFITSLAVPESGGLPIGNYLFLLPILMAIFIPVFHFSKLMNLGGKRLDFFKSCISTYILVIFVTVLVSLISYYTVDKLLEVRTEATLSLWPVFKFIGNNPVIAFLQMFSLFFLICSIIHTLSLAQAHWYGWLSDILIIAVISVFTPIASLRSGLVWFFNLIIFNDSAFLQIISTLVLGAIIYCISIIPIRNKKI